MLASVNDVTKLRSRCLHVPTQILKVIITTQMNMETNLLTHTTEAPFWRCRNIMGLSPSALPTLLAGVSPFMLVMALAVQPVAQP